MSAFGKCKGGGRRRAARQQLPLTVVSRTRTRTQHGVLVDLSGTGARLRGSDLPQANEDVFLSIEGIHAYGVVIWSRLGFCGIAFDSPLPPGSMQALQQKVAKARGLPPEIMAAMEDWELGVAR